MSVNIQKTTLSSVGLPFLAQVGALISGSADLGQTLAVLLRIMERQLGLLRGMVTLYHRSSGKVLACGSLGLTDEEAIFGVFPRASNLTSKVVEFGRPIVVRDIRTEPSLANTDRIVSSDAEVSFFCLPILRGSKVLGTISVETLFDGEENLEHLVELLGVVAVLVAQEAELYLLEREEPSRLGEENRRLQNELQARYRPSNILGDSPAMRTVFHFVEKVAKSRASVVILGESGVGKELVASAIHYASPWSAGPFVRLNCAGLPEALADQELFGSEKGLFEAARDGTLFLDEVAELSLSLQAKLLNALHEKPDSNPAPKAGPRVLAATRRDLEVLVAQGKFREDFFYRLGGFPITVPPLRDRGGDVLTLADHFVTKAAREAGKTIRGISTPAINLLMAHPWPGNVRELESCLERAVLLTDEEFIHAHHLPPSLHASQAGSTRVAEPAPVPGLSPGTTLEDHLGSIEKAFLVRTLEETRGNMAEAARRLGLTKRMMLLRMDKFALDYQVFRRAVAETSALRR